MNEMKTAWETRKKQIAKTALVGATIIIAYQGGKLVGANDALKTINTALIQEQLLKHLQNLRP